jgi:hypothetical protein
LADQVAVAIYWITTTTTTKNQRKTKICEPSFAIWPLICKLFHLLPQPALDLSKGQHNFDTENVY